MGKNHLDVTVTAALLAGTLILLSSAIAIQAPANVFPIAVLLITGLLALAALFIAIKKMLSGEKAAILFPVAGRRLLTATIAGLILYVATMSFGYLASTYVFLCALYVLLSGNARPRTIAISATVAALVTGFVYLCFAVWLGVNLPV